MYLLTSKNNNITYSIDKIRLKTYITYSLFSEIEFRFETCWKEFLKDKYTSPGISRFFYNYNIEIGEGKSFWFGFLHNSEDRVDKDSATYNFTIEFNPNKLKDNKIILYLLSISGQWYLRRIDMAMDIPVSILDIIGYEKGHKREVKIISKGFDDKTIYIGKDNARVKIYNKKIESKLNIMGELTRIEITTEFDDFDICNIKFLYYPDNFPCLYLNNYIYSLKDYEDKTLFALLFAVQNGLSIDMLTRTYRKKVKNLLEAGNKIRFDIKTATEVLRKVIFHYFINNSLVIFK